MFLKIRVFGLASCVAVGWPCLLVNSCCGLRVFHPYRSDGCWWIDAPDGAGVYIQRSPDDLPPSGGKWEPLSAKAASVLPQLRVQQRPNTN